MRRRNRPDNMKNKKEDPNTHANRRLMERYGMSMTDSQLEALAERCVIGDYISSTPVINGNRKIDIKFKKMRFLLIFSPSKLKVMTFLTPPVRIRERAMKKVGKKHHDTLQKRKRLARNPRKQWT